MTKNYPQLDFNNDRKPTESFELFEHVIEDRGSRYSVSVGKVTGKDDIAQFLKILKQKKKYAKATHNSYAARISQEGAIYATKNDDGEAGAGMVILRVLEKNSVTDCIVCVTRWFGGVKLMNDRFKHIQNATLHALLNGAFSD